MNKYIPAIPAEFVLPLNMNKLRGRMLYLPAKKGKKREILFVYGHHASLERYFAHAQVLNDYGSVTIPDLPGFGGMQSFYKIGEKPNLDTLADYLATFVRWRFKRKKITLIGYSVGFLIITRMLQKYPDIAKKVDLLISGAGYAHHEDFKFSRSRLIFYRLIARIFSYPVSSWWFRYFVLNTLSIRLLYIRTFNAKKRYKYLNDEQKAALAEFDIRLWHENDLRTYMAVSTEMFNVNNCTIQVDLPVWHTYVSNDHYFNNRLVEQHMRVIFKDFHKVKVNLKQHATDIIADKKTSAPLLPKEIRAQLRKS